MSLSVCLFVCLEDLVRFCLLDMAETPGRGEMGNECVYTCGVLCYCMLALCVFCPGWLFAFFLIPSMVTLMLMIEYLFLPISNHRETVDVTYSLGRLRNFPSVREKQEVSF